MDGRQRTVFISWTPIELEFITWKITQIIKVPLCIFCLGGTSPRSFRLLSIFWRIFASKLASSSSLWSMKFGNSASESFFGSSFFELRASLTDNCTSLVLSPDVFCMRERDKEINFQKFRKLIIKFVMQHAMFLHNHEKRLNSRYSVITNPLSSLRRRGSSKTSWLLLIFCFTDASSFSSSSASSPNESKFSFLHCANRNTHLKQSKRNIICIRFCLLIRKRWCSTKCGKKLTLQLSSLYLYSQPQLWFGLRALKVL